MGTLFEGMKKMEVLKKEIFLSWREKWKSQKIHSEINYVRQHRATPCNVWREGKKKGESKGSLSPDVVRNAHGQEWTSCSLWKYRLLGSIFFTFIALYPPFLNSTSACILLYTRRELQVFEFIWTPFRTRKHPLFLLVLFSLLVYFLVVSIMNEASIVIGPWLYLKDVSILYIQ